MRIELCAAIVFTGLAPSMCTAQAPGTAPAFEVASVKASTPEDHVIGLFTHPGGRITASLYTLEMLIEEAFDVQPFQVSGGPHWIQTERYDVEAKPPASSPSSHANPPYDKAPPNSEQRQMLVSLLVDRFQLKFHREAREGPVYLLVKGKALRLEPPKDPDAFPWAGRIGGGSADGNGIAGTNISMPQLAARLSGFLARQVLDRTGLTGAFDFKFALPADPHPDIVSSIFASMQGIGLKLEASRGPVDTIAIDHAEKPSGN